MTFGYISSHSHPPHSLPTHPLTLTHSPLTPSHSPPPHSQLFLPGQPLPSRLRVEVQSIKGDADLFLSQSCTAPSQVRYTLCDQDVGGSEFCLSMDDKDYDVNKVCVCVCVCVLVYTVGTCSTHVYLCVSLDSVWTVFHLGYWAHLPPPQILTNLRSYY